MQRLVARVPADELPPFYPNGWRDFLSESAVPAVCIATDLGVLQGPASHPHHQLGLEVSLLHGRPR